MALPLSEISVSSVAQILEEPSYDVGTLCRSLKVNKWSKRKPYVDTRAFRNSARYWERSDVAPSIRCGFIVSNDADTVWLYQRVAVPFPFRLGDFRGYDHTIQPDVTLIFNNEFTRDESYEASFVFSGFTGIDLAGDNTGVVGLHDMFDIQNKYCCLKLEVELDDIYILNYSDKISYAEGASLFGANVVISSTDVERLANKGGTISMKLSLIEADEYTEFIGFVNPIEFSIRANENLTTSHLNNQFRRAGFDIYSNFDTQTPTKSGTTISSSTYERVVVSSLNKTGGTFSGHYFQARIIGNQVGTNYTYLMPSHTLAVDEDYDVDIPDFSLTMLDEVPSLLEYTVWEGAPNVSDLVLKYIYNI